MALVAFCFCAENCLNMVIYLDLLFDFDLAGQLQSVDVGNLRNFMSEESIGRSRSVVFDWGPDEPVSREER